MPFGDRRNSQGNLGTDRLFTGQRQDGTGLYYYGGRYYDPIIGRFISADTFVPWSTGFDVVSNQLSVNIIPQGLGVVLAPQGNYPSVTAEAPTNPQMLNRYSYVVNNPLRYTDPYGWWTFAISLNVFAGTGIGINVSIGLVIDGHGNIAVATTPGGGGVGGVSLNGGLQFQWTNADNVKQLEAWSSQSGGSTDFPNAGLARAGIDIGVECVVGLGEKPYAGGNLNIGVGVGVGLTFPP